MPNLTAILFLLINILLIVLLCLFFMTKYDKIVVYLLNTLSLFLF